MTTLYEFNQERVTHKGLQEWKPNYIISVSGEYPASVVESRNFRDEVHAKIHTLFEEEWRTTPNKDFKPV